VRGGAAAAPPLHLQEGGGWAWRASAINKPNPNTKVMLLTAQPNQKEGGKCKGELPPPLQAAGGHGLLWARKRH